MIPLHPEFITKNGKKEFVVIPYEEFEALQELIADIAAFCLLRDPQILSKTRFLGLHT